MNQKLQERITNAIEKAPSNQNYVSVKEALGILPVSREALYKKLKSGELPCFKFGRKIFVDVDEVLAVMRVQTQRQIDR